MLNQRLAHRLMSAEGMRLTNEAARDFLSQQPSYIPVYTDVEHGGQVVWADVGTHQFQESKFRYFLDRLAEQEKQPKTIVTSLDLFAANGPVDNTVLPSGFILSVHRCGSTLLAKALARSPKNNVLIEPTVLEEGFWSTITDGWSCAFTTTAEKCTLIRNLVLALGRRRADRHERFFVKLHPWHILFIDAITQAFPDVPCLFLYRNGVEVMVSMLKTPAPVPTRVKGTEAGGFLAGVSAQETAAMSDLAYFSQMHRRYLEMACSIARPRFAFLQYERLTKKNLNAILQAGFAVNVPGEELRVMQEQFDYYSKDDSNSSTFHGDSASKRNIATPAVHAEVESKIQPLHEQVERSARNLKLEQ